VAGEPSRLAPATPVLCVVSRSRSNSSSNSSRGVNREAKCTAARTNVQRHLMCPTSQALDDIHTHTCTVCTCVQGHLGLQATCAAAACQWHRSACLKLCRQGKCFSTRCCQLPTLLFKLVLQRCKLRGI
jgi:hypothetical protein